MNRPGSIKIFKPSGRSSGTSRAAYFCGVRMSFAGGGFPPGRRAAGERGLINDAQPAADAEKFQRVFFLQPPQERQDLAHGLLKRAGPW